MIYGQETSIEFATSLDWFNRRYKPSALTSSSAVGKPRQHWQFFYLKEFREHKELNQWQVGSEARIITPSFQLIFGKQ